LREPPSGTVTFLFTDIEGSTRLWERDPAAMRIATARHDDLLGSVIQEHHGSLYNHIGDAVQAAFSTPADALASAVAAQRALMDEQWPETGPLRVRMALHVGEAAHDAHGDYHQVACLNRLARLLAAGSGGQILLTQAVRQQINGLLPSGVSLIDLGKHRLRDLLEPEWISQAARLFDAAEAQYETAGF
jgi:class 3 adenylate cyclase